MTFVDSNVLMFAVGKAHPLQAEAQKFLVRAIQDGVVLGTSAEILKEMLHVYKSTGRIELFENVLALVTELGMEVWPLESKVRMFRLHATCMWRTQSGVPAISVTWLAVGGGAFMRSRPLMRG